MNQSIQFPGIQEWQAAEQRICFSAQYLGALIPCYISRHQLEHLAGRSLSREDELLLVFEEHRFDIEESAEHKIEEQEFGEDGAIYL